jgi:hypothetical protein
VAVDIAIKNGWMHAGTFGISTALQHPLATYDIPELIALAKPRVTQHRADRSPGRMLRRPGIHRVAASR